MQIGSTGDSLQQRRFSGTGNIGRVHIPDFNDNYVYTKKKSDTTESEYRKKIEWQAYKDFADGKFQNESEGFNALMKQYVSEVSPNRKGIITSGLKAVSKNWSNIPKPIDVVAVLLEGEIRYQKQPFGKSEYIEFYDENGEKVAKYSNNGWTMCHTKKEVSRQIQMCMIYNEAWGDAKRGVSLTDDNELNSQQSVFDVTV